MSEFGKMIAPYARRISNMLARGTVAAVNAASKMQGLQLRILAGEVKDGVEHFEPYGFTSHPNGGAEAVAIFLDGDRSHGIVLCVADRRYRLAGLKTGEVALHDDQGQRVHLTRSGVVIDGGGLPLTIQNAPTVTMTAAVKVRVEAALFEVTGDIKDNCDQPGGNTMYAMRIAYNGHRHRENNVAGGSTDTPSQAM